MVSRRTILIGAMALPFAGLLGACGNPQQERVVVTGEVVATRAPPPMPMEPVPPPPYGSTDTMTWMPGYWRWNGTDYVWTPGAYVSRPRREAYWIPARWDYRAGTWVYVEGHWG
jgi:hypothetical protein